MELPWAERNWAATSLAAAAVPRARHVCAVHWIVFSLVVSVVCSCWRAVGHRHNVEDCLAGVVLGALMTFASIKYYRLDFDVSRLRKRR